MYKHWALLLSLVFVILSCGADPASQIPVTTLEPGSTREIAYTDKGDAFWVTATGAYHNSPWHGLTASKRQYFEDLFISLNGVLLPREQALVTVDPVQLVRAYPELGVKETWTLLDTAKTLMIVLEAEQAGDWSIQPAILGGNSLDDFEIKPFEQSLDIHLRRFEELSSAYPFMKISFSQNMEWEAAMHPGKTLYNGFLTQRAVSKGSQNLTILVSLSKESDEIEWAPGAASAISSIRRNRIGHLILQSSVVSTDKNLDQAIAWAHASVDALIMDQMGTGIYAGLPWFDDYWGRDVFISFAGATLVSGKATEAKRILTSFAKFQNTDPSGKNYGRVPNRAQPEDIIYNTTDGTPWFIRSVWDYYRYTGDETFLFDIWPSIQIATQGALDNWVDENGLLTHDDADTWMDAKGPDGPWSPRGNRALEIQFIWRDQLEITRRLAKKFGKAGLANQCQVALDQLEQGLKLYQSASEGYQVDHLNSDDSQDPQVRPNAMLVTPLFFETCDWPTFQFLAPQLLTRNGVISLDQHDPNFHPFHEQPGLYVKDAAYHNGIIWTWNSAAVVSAAMHFNQQHYAQALFMDLTDHLLNRGAVGTLAELTDAWPSNGTLGLSGTFSQAWSLAEYLRVFYQDILGVQPDLTQNRVRISPRLFEDLNQVTFNHPVGTDFWTFEYEESESSFELSLTRAASDSLDLSIELLVGEELPKIEFTWAQRMLHLRYEKHMGQWTVPASIADYRQTRISSEYPKDSLPFCEIDTLLDVPVLQGPEHRLLREVEVIPGSEKYTQIKTLSDPSHDDLGDGNAYSYPLNAQFEPGIVDILSLKIGANDSDYLFELVFRNLVDPGWHPEYGYQLTYCALGLNFSGSQGNSEIGKNAAAQYQGEFKADQTLYVSGGVLLVDDKLQPRAEYMPRTPNGAIGSSTTETVKFRLPRDLFTGDLEQAKIQLAVGFQDDHGGAGLGDFRSVETDASQWSGGGRRTSNDSNVYDWLIE